MKLASPAKGRYVRLLLSKAATPEGYILSEMEVYGRGGPLPHRSRLGKPGLAGGAWRIQRDSLAGADGAALSKPGFHPDADWLVATVPGTVLTSYYNAGALPDPNYGDNQLAISDSFFYADFWYRNEFVIPPVAPGKHVWLNFDGINWKADVFFNGEKLGRIEGGFMRGGSISQAVCMPDRRTRWPCWWKRMPRPAASRRRLSITPIRTAARWARITRPIMRPSAGTGFPRFAAATPVSGTMCI
jgi:hypothetical protein